jgi:hypothetical protein
MNISLIFAALLAVALAASGHHSKKHKDSFANFVVSFLLKSSFRTDEKLLAS